MAKEDFCFTYYDGDAARDKAHMTRLERGAYDDLISAQRKRGHLSIDDIKRVLSKDFDECWSSLEWILKKDDEGKYFIEWVDLSIQKMRKHSENQKNRIKKYWDGKKKNDPGYSNNIPRNNHGIEMEEPLEDGNEDGNEDEYRKIENEIEQLILQNEERRFKSNELADYFFQWLKRLGIESKREFTVNNDGDRNDRFDLLVFNYSRPSLIVEVKNYTRHDDYYKPLKQIERYSKHGLPILFVPNFKTSLSRLQSCISYLNNGVCDDSFVFDPNSTNGSFNWDVEKEKFMQDGKWIFKFCSDKNLQADTFDHLAREFLSDLELKEDYKPIKEIRSHFTNWFNKKQNGTHSKTPGSKSRPVIRDIPKRGFGQL